MKTSASLFALCAAYLLINTAAAYSSSGPFYLPGGVVPPQNGHLFVSLKSLPSYLSYDINCDIENPTYNKPYPVVIEFKEGSLNNITSPSNLYLLDQLTTKYHARLLHLDVEHHNSLMFTNHDSADAVFVKNCIANYSTN